MALRPEEIKALLKERGWSMVDLAARWEISSAWLSTLINKTEGDRRPKMYEDAFRGLPPRSSVTVVRQARHIRKPPKRKARLWSFDEMFPRGRLFQATNSQIADEGTRFVVIETRTAGLERSVLMQVVDEDDQLQGDPFEVPLEQATAHLDDLCTDLAL